LTNPDNVLQKAGGSDVAITINTSLVDGRTASFISQFSSNSTTKTINGKPWRIPGDTVSPRTISGYAYTVWYDANADCFFLKSTDKNIIIGTIATYGGWSGASAPYTNTITVSSVSAGDNILVSIGAGATAAEYAAAVDAQLHCSAQADSSVTITAFGTKPTIDIPITIVILH
jgi:hypothetical protein